VQEFPKGFHGVGAGPSASDEELSLVLDEYLREECLVLDPFCSRWGKKINTHRALSFFVHTEKTLLDMRAAKEEADKQRIREKEEKLEKGTAVLTEDDVRKAKGEIREAERRMDEERARMQELAKKISSRIRKMSETDMADTYRASLHRMNEVFFREYDDDVSCVVTNVCNLVKYERLDPSGPRRGRISAEAPLVYQYFAHVKAFGYEGTDYLSQLQALSLNRPHVYGQDVPNAPSPVPGVSVSPLPTDERFLGLPAVSNGVRLLGVGG
jgi:hypothetical protein